MEGKGRKDEDVEKDRRMVWKRMSSIGKGEKKGKEPRANKSLTVP